MIDPSTPRPTWYTASLQGGMDVTELLDAVFGEDGDWADEREAYAETLQGYVDFSAIMEDPS